MKMTKLGCGIVMSAALLYPAFGQSRANPPQPTPAQPVGPQNDDELARMRDDLNKLESLNLNMSSEIEFLHDQNLQILLRTNSQMWGVLIRDLRRQIEREEQRNRNSPVPGR